VRCIIKNNFLKNYDVVVYQYKFDKNLLQLAIKNDMIKNKLIDLFSIESKNKHFNKSKKNNQWDGKHRIIKKIYNDEEECLETVIPKGLWYELYSVCKKYNFSIDFKLKVINKELEFEKIKNYIDKKYEIKKYIKNDIRDFQYNCIFDLLKFEKICGESLPASGKSLIMYIACRMMLDKNLKTLIIVPNVALCEQMENDFKNYGFENVEKYVQIINGTIKEKNISKHIVISTWQTFQNVENLEWVDLLICDESDTSSNKKGKYFNIINRCENKKYLLALTGTFPDKKYADYYYFIGNTGKHILYGTKQILEKLNQITKVEIHVKILNYTTVEKKLFYSELNRELEAGDFVKIKDLNFFKDEKINYDSFKNIINKIVKIDAIKNNEYIIDNIKIKKSWIITETNYLKELRLISNNKNRLEWLLNEVEKTDGNTLILFSKISKEGDIIKEYFSKNLKFKKLIYVDGKTQSKNDELNLVRNDNDGKTVLLANIACLGRGITIKNLKYCFLATSIKSQSLIVQAIGRIARLSENKECAFFIDIVDNLTLRDGDKLLTNNSTASFIEREKEYINREYLIKKEQISL